MKYSIDLKRTIVNMNYLRDSEGYILLEFPRPTQDFVNCLRRGHFNTKTIYGTEFNEWLSFHAIVSKVQGQKLYITDGDNKISVMLASQAVAKVSKLNIRKGDLIRIEHYSITQDSNNRRLVIVCDFNRA